MKQRSRNVPVVTRRDILLVLLATGASLIEGLIPRPIPFIKPGLANVVTVSAVMRYGTFTALRVNVLRATGAAMVLGILATPTYLLSLCGGIASALIMGLSRRIFSVTGISVCGSMASLWIQLLIACLILPGLPAAGLLLPLSAWGFLSGTFTGIVAVVLLRKGFPWIPAAGVDSARLPE